MDKFIAIFTSSNFKIGLGLWALTFIILVLLYWLLNKEKIENKLLNRIDTHRNYQETDVIDNYIYKSTHNTFYIQYIEPFVLSNKNLYNKLLKLFGINIEKIHRNLLKANIHRNISAEQIATVKLMGVFLGGGIGFILLFTSGLIGIVVAGVIFLIFFFLPDILIKEKMTQRSNTILDELPIVSRLLADATATGHTISDAINRVSYKYKGVLAEEFKMVEHETKYTNFIDALENMGYRLDIPDLNNLISEVKITQERGTGITEVLRGNAAKLREEKSIRMTEKARKKTTNMFIPIFLFLFTPLLGLILLPAVSTILNSL